MTPTLSQIVGAAARGGVCLSLIDAILLQEAIASSVLEGAEVPDDEGLARLARAITSSDPAP